MQLSIHYYVLSLSEQTSRLYEGFRDKLIDIQDANFPFEYSDAGKTASPKNQLREFFLQTDQRFAHYYAPRCGWPGVSDDVPGLQRFTDAA